MKYTKISKAEALQVTSKKGYCLGCGAYGRLTPSDFANSNCKYCRPLCEGSNEYPSANMVQGTYATCYKCGRKVKLDTEFGRMRRHSVLNRVRA